MKTDTKASLKIKFEDIPPEGLELEFEDPEGQLVKDCFPVKCPIKARVFIRRWGINVKINGQVETVLLLSCDRCLEEFPFEIQEKIDVELQPIASLKVSHEEVRLTKEELDVIFFDGETIEVDEVIREQILLAVPMRKLCRAECRGLCPICGQNLNLKECGCKPKIKDSPFAILKKLVISSG